jgi:beta-glucanase (GH16 family)
MKALTRIAALLLSALSLGGGTAHAAQIWSEEFNTGSVPDPVVWSYDLGNWGWGNQELQNYTAAPQNVRVEGGHLIITARQETNGQFTSARIRTQDKLTFQYGTVEARIKIPDLGNGLWPAFWTLGNNFGSVGWPHCGEIDVLEMGSGAAIANGDINRRVYSTAHWDFGGNYASYGQELVTGADLDNGFHIWRMEWTPTSIRTYVDGQQIWVMSISNPQSFGGEEFHAPHFFILNLAVGGNFTGIWSSSGITAPMPAEYRVDYVRLYDNGHTILNSPFAGTVYCTPDWGSCPCGNGGDGGSGCANSSSAGGALNASGSASVAADDLVLNFTGGLPGQPCLFFQGDNQLNGGDGVTFGDGLRCAGGNVVRLQVRIPDASGEASTTASIAAKGGVSVGDVRQYQGWYRDNGLSCGFTFNTTNGYSVVWKL